MLIDISMNSVQLPSIWKQAYMALYSSGATEALIAGGALRDLWLGGEVKDVDIFISANTIIPESFIPLLQSSNPESAIGDRSITSQGIFCFQKNSTAFNIIRCNSLTTPQQRFERFDFGICKIAYGIDGLITHPEFLYDIKHQQMTLRRCDSANLFIQSVKRYNRFRLKYPWPMVIPSDLELHLL